MRGLMFVAAFAALGFAAQLQAGDQFAQRVVVDRYGRAQIQRVVVPQCQQQAFVQQRQAFAQQQRFVRPRTPVRTALRATGRFLTGNTLRQQQRRAFRQSLQGQRVVVAPFTTVRF